MWDSENAQQPSRKRAALSSALETGTFMIASEEVLASRRIVKVKRRDPSAAEASNRFAGIRLVPFTAPAPYTTAAEPSKYLSGLNSTPCERKQQTQGNRRSDATKKPDGKKKYKSDTRNAAVGKKETQDNATSAFKRRGSLYLGEENSVETGEENEKSVFTAFALLYESDEEMKFRGEGVLKVNISTDNRKARLIMRSKGNYRLIFNASIYPEMRLANLTMEGISFDCVNRISEAKNGLSLYVLMFNDPSLVGEFGAVVEKIKGVLPRD